MALRKAARSGTFLMARELRWSVLQAFPAQRAHPRRTNASLDNALLPHHDDHMGAITQDSPQSRFGDYQASATAQPISY
jgi:hypothetical protein